MTRSSEGGPYDETPLRAALAGHFGLDDVRGPQLAVVRTVDRRRRRVGRLTS